MNGLKPAVDSPARFRKWVIKGRQQKVLPPFVIIKSNHQPATTLCGGKGEFPMTCTEEYKEHIEYTFHAFCKIVIRNASYTALRTWSRKHKREISLDYITDEKHYPFPHGGRHSSCQLFAHPTVRGFSLPPAHIVVAWRQKGEVGVSKRWYISMCCC